MRVLVAFDKFKDALGAPAACAAAAAALRERHPDWTVVKCPLADGGEGFAPILTAAAQGQTVVEDVMGPRGETHAARYGRVLARRVPAAVRQRLGGLPESDAELAVIEMAAASGLMQVPIEHRDVWTATSAGTGQLIKAAADAKVAAILLGVGGSATHDLGLGALAALGLEFQDAAGAAIWPPYPKDWRRIVRVGGRLAPLPPLFLACDVANPLLGARGAAAVYGPQKGLRPEDLPRLEAETARLAALLGEGAAVPGAGAAGGIAFGLMAAARARLVPGADLISDWLDLDRKIAEADLVITGEGRFDDSSVEGKGPGALARAALARGRKVLVLAGNVVLSTPPAAAMTVTAITPPGTPLREALKSTEINLRAALARVSLG